jgi:hypothetical protein
MYKNYINLENFNHKLVIIVSSQWQEGVTHAFPIPREWQDGAGHMVASSWWQHSL